MADETRDDDPEGLEPTNLPPTASSPPAGEARDQIGPYRLLQKVGEGGMGEVYKAEQTHPVRRLVALKVIKAGMDTKQVVARFEAERQALAIMDHPAVARVFDAGVTPSGRPYFAMEYVKGVPITEHCDRHKLTTRERLDLFMQVCEGVQHAHQKAIIHRDLKPSNVLVALREGKPEPKIIDFGVAKAIAQKLTERTMFTELGVLIGTPEYMSPEQAEMTGQEVDTRTDVYSLGVMLYELLSGALPFDSQELRSAGFDGIRRRIREDEPPKPSNRLSSLGGKRSTESARLRHVDLPTLRRQLSGDLDWITMKALEKDLGRRYGSPQELAMDIRRYLRDEPVSASPPSTLYRARKFTRRHRIGVTAAATGALVLLAFVVTMTIQTGRIAAERDRANREAERGRTEADKSDQVATFMTELLAGVGPSVARGRDTTMLREILDETSERVGTDLVGQPEVEATIRSVLGTTYRDLGEYERADPHLREALELRRRTLGDDHPDTLKSIHDLGMQVAHHGTLAEAESYLREALQGSRRVLGNDHPDTLKLIQDLGSLIGVQGKADEAEPLLLEGLEGCRRVLGDNDPHTLESFNDVANLFAYLGRLAEAFSYSDQALKGRRLVLGNDHPDTLESIDDMGILLVWMDRWDEAEPYLLEALRGRRRVLGDDHQDTLQSVLHGPGDMLMARETAAQTEPYFRMQLNIRRQLLGNDHPGTLEFVSSMGFLLELQGKLGEAEPYHREALDGFHRALGREHPWTLISMGNLGDLYTSQGHNGKAEALLGEAVEGLHRSLSRGHVMAAPTIRKYGRLLTHRKSYAEAESTLLEAYETLATSEGEHRQTHRTVTNLGELYDAWGKPDKASEWRAKLSDSQ